MKKQRVCGYECPSRVRSVWEPDACVLPYGHREKHKCKHGVEWWGGSMRPFGEAMDLLHGPAPEAPR